MDTTIMINIVWKWGTPVFKIRWRGWSRQTAPGGADGSQGQQASAFHLAGNREMLARYWEFRSILEAVRAQNPLKHPAGYYPYGTIHIIPQILPLLEKHGLDLRAEVEGKTILDLGCGDGELSFFLEYFHPERVIALDATAFNYNGMEACSTLKAALGSHVEFINANVHTLDFGGLPSFDTIFCFGFLYHSPHPMWVLQNLARSTRTLFLTTKVFDSEEPYAYFYDTAECNNDPTNWWCFSPKALTRMLKRAGFRVTFTERLDPHLGRSHPVDLDRDGRMFVHAVVNE